MYKKIIIGTRGSKLSLAYAGRVKNLLISLNPSPKIHIDIKIIKTTGDLNVDKKISELGGKNYFCKEIEDQLFNKKIDIAVHSLKDMETFENKNLVVAAYLKRNDPRDILVMKDKDFISSSKNYSIGSSSKRRELQMKLLFKNFATKEIRGNIDTRIEKVKHGKYDGVMLAAAGLKTLSLEKYISKYFSINEVIPAAGQGVIAVQCRSDEKEIKEYLSKIGDNNTKICASCEKELLKTIRGDCHTAVGAYAEIKSDKLKLIAKLFSDDEKRYFYSEASGGVNEYNTIGKKVGLELLEKSGDSYKKKS